jgi:hypothetical protein
MKKIQIKLNNAEVLLLIAGLDIWDDEYEGTSDYEMNDKKNVEAMRAKLAKSLKIKI